MDVGWCTSNISWDVRPLWSLIVSRRVLRQCGKKSARVARYKDRAVQNSSGLILVRIHQCRTRRTVEIQRRKVPVPGPVRTARKLRSEPGVWVDEEGLAGCTVGPYFFFWEKGTRAKPRWGSNLGLGLGVGLTGWKVGVGQGALQGFGWIRAIAGGRCQMGRASEVDRRANLERVARVDDGEVQSEVWLEGISEVKSDDHRPVPSVKTRDGEVC